MNLKCNDRLCENFHESDSSDYLTTTVSRLMFLRSGCWLGGLSLKTTTAVPGVCAMMVVCDSPGAPGKASPGE